MRPVASARLAGRLRRARPRDIATAVRALSWSVVARVAMRIRGFRGAVALLGFRPVDEPAPDVLRDPSSSRAVRVADRTLSLARLRITCLPHAIATERVLLARGVVSDVVLGVRTGETFAAHAWVEVGGKPVVRRERGDDAWVPVARFRSRGARRLSPEPMNATADR